MSKEIQENKESIEKVEASKQQAEQKLQTEQTERNQQMEQENPEEIVKTIVIDLFRIKQTKAFARQDGAILGAVWIASFICTMLAANPSMQMLGLVANLLLISTPFVMAKRLKIFRDDVREGHISFMSASFYCFQTFFYATLLLTIVQYLWFRFMDMGPFMSQLQASYQMIAQTYQLTANETKEVLNAIFMMKPIAWAAMFMITDIVAGIVLSPIIGAVMAKKNLNQM